MTTETLPPPSAVTEATAPQLTDSQAAVLGALLAHPGATTAELSQDSGVSASATAKALTLLAGMGITARTTYEPRDGKRVASTWQIIGGPLLPIETPGLPQRDIAPIDESAGNDGGASSPADRRVGRLRSGELRDLVAGHLAERPDIEFTPTMLSHLLGRSAGAIRNCLDRLTSDGAVQLVNDKPVRFRHVVPELASLGDHA